MVILLLTVVWSRARELAYGAWALLYAYLLVDDALQVHELGGAAIANAFGYVSRFGLRAVDYGELTVSAVVGVVLLGGVLYAYLRSSASARYVSQDLGLLFAALVFFGVGFDMLHAVAGGTAVGGVLGLIEDGGEMLAISATAWYMLGVARCREEISQPLWQSLRTALVHRSGGASLSSPRVG